MNGPEASRSSFSKTHPRHWLIPIAALVATTMYVVAAYSHGLYGFPLDDAWIHQTYARNLAQTGQLAYLPGQPSAGSTSPAWSFLLSVGYLLGIDYHLWAYLLGAIALGTTAWLGCRLLVRLAPPRIRSGWASRPVVALLAGLLCAVEWHLVWAAASGMETMLFTALSLALLEYSLSYIADRRSAEGPASLWKERMVVSAVGIGLVGGMLTLTRPEGLGLVGLVAVALMLLPWPPSRGNMRSRLLAVALALVACGLLLAPYIVFNLKTSNSMFPNTFYAKQAEYRAEVALPDRFWRVLSPTLVGAQVLLVPGFFYIIVQLGCQRNWSALVPGAWWLALLAAYALRLPAAYQHGRYSMPTIPFLLLYGVWGTADLLRPRSPHLLVRVLSRATPAAVALLALVFWIRGALAYRDDVGLIEGEMVAMAHWLNEQTAPDSLVAVHDIGAVGYLTDRPLLDLAGLISPQVVPFITDAQRLIGWMVDAGADYVVLFPDFSPTYVQLSADPRLQQVHCTDHEWTRAQGHKNMCVYRLPLGQQP